MKQSCVSLGLILSLVAPVAAHAVTWGEFLRGHWMTECKRSNGRYTQTAYTFSDFSGPEFELVVLGTAYYYDAKCTKIFSFAQNLGKLSLKAMIGLQPPTDSPKDGAKIRWQMNPLIQYPYAVYDKKGVKELNDKIQCGQSDWQVGVAKDLLQTNCGKELRDYYSTNWFYLEVVDKDNVRMIDKNGAKDDIKRWAFSVPGDNGKGSTVTKPVR